jgi:hypothetical protein
MGYLGPLKRGQIGVQAESQLNQVFVLFADWNAYRPHVIPRQIPNPFRVDLPGFQKLNKGFLFPKSRQLRFPGIFHPDATEKKVTTDRLLQDHNSAR